MKLTLLLIAFIVYLPCAWAQTAASKIKGDFNQNGIPDWIIATDTSLLLSIDRVKKTIPFDRFGFEVLSELSYQNAIITIRGRNEGTGAFTWSYKFRYNKEEMAIELIGFDSFSKWISGSIQKSVNLLTRRYIIQVENYNDEKDKMDVQEYKGVIKKTSVYLTNIEETAFDEFNALGSELTPK